jgi:hypothetical protein
MGKVVNKLTVVIRRNAKSEYSCEYEIQKKTNAKFPAELVTQGYELAERGEKLMDVVYVLDDESMQKEQGKIFNKYS